EIFGDAGVVGIAVNALDAGWDRLPRVGIALFDDLEVVQRVLNQEIVVAANRTGDACSHSQRGARRSRYTPLCRLDDDDAVAGARSVDRGRRRVLQYLNRGDVVRVDEVRVRIR